MTTKTVVFTAVLALALPAAAQANDGHESSSDDHQCNKSQEVRHMGEAHEAKSKSDRGHHHHGRKSHRSHGLGFALRGSSAATALPVTDGKLTGPLTLDPSGANRHARKFLALTKEQVDGTQTATFGETGDAVKVRYVGLSATDPIQPTDVVKVLGKVKRTRNADGTKTYGPLDVRYIVVKRPS